MCWYCGTPIDDPEPIGRSLRCLECGKDLRSCRNCRHYLPGSCAESQAEKPYEQDRANFCDWFSLNGKFRKATAGERNSGAAESSKTPASSNAAASAKAAFDDLFK
ncbi:MAG: hypothetical protein FWF26_04795 [Treponema sp.]|nr:hypothetical protein [Treponema sp.]